MHKNKQEHLFKIISICRCAIFCFIVFAILHTQTKAANIATAGQDDGYSGRILDKITQKWKPPHPMGKYRLNIVLAVEGDGKLADCRVIKSSGIDALDASACAAARAASPYGSPPYGMPASIFFSFWSDNDHTKRTSPDPGAIIINQPYLNNAVPSPQVEKSPHEINQEADRALATSANPSKDAAYSQRYDKYISRLRWDLRNKMFIPKETKPGVYNALVEIKCDKTGKILSSSMLKSSGDAVLDRYVMQGIKRAGKVVAPPKDFGDTFKIDFRLVRN